ncbi:MAG: hypothetical protein P8X55_21460, partial [Desulfosarcinaceae bacterium]
MTNQTVDGLSVGTGWKEIVSAGIFGGVAAGAETSGSAATFGGRLAVHPRPAYEMGISYENTDLEGDPDQKAGIDISFNQGGWLTLQGLSSYNMESNGWREHNYAAVLRYKDISLEPAYQLFSYKDYFGVGREQDNIFHFLKESDEQVIIAGGEIQYQASGPVRLGTRYNHYSYDLRREAAEYYAALLSVDFNGGSQLG